MVSATLDTNIYVSALQYGGAGARLLGMARARMIRVDVSDAIVNETVHVLRDKFGWSGERLQEAKRQIASFTNLVTPAQMLDVIKEDPDDNRVLECAQTAGSDFVVSEDKDLL